MNVPPVVGVGGSTVGSNFQPPKLDMECRCWLSGDYNEAKSRLRPKQSLFFFYQSQFLDIVREALFFQV